VPFCEHAVAREAANIPVRWRTHGMFQSRMLERLDPRLAAYPSAYGHSFVEPPTWRHRLSDGVSLYRPAWLRRYSFRMKRALSRRPDPRSGYFAPAFLGRTIDLAFPVMSRFFDMTRLLAPDQFAAAATLEYLAQYFADRLRG